MEGGHDADRVRRKEELACNILQLTLGCPHDQCNPSFCPLFEVRKLDLDERVQWVHRLTDEDLEYLSTYHEICLLWRATGGVENPKRGRQKNAR